MSVAERHRGHLRAARCLAAGNTDPERVAAHLLVVERLADPWVIAGLREAARAARGKGAPGSSVTYLQRALAEPPEPAGLSELLAELGTAQLSAGDGAGYTTLRQAIDQAADPPAAARVALALSRAARTGDNYRHAEDVVVATARGTRRRRARPARRPAHRVGDHQSDRDDPRVPHNRARRGAGRPGGGPWG